jgi:hypothetical protein
MASKTDKNLKLHSLLSQIIMGIGVLLLVFMIITEDEPGALPLFLLLAGSIWYFITRYRIRSLSHQK